MQFAILVVLVSGLTASLAFSAPVAAKADCSLAKVQARYKALSSIEASFTQSVSSPRYAATPSSGKVYFRFPGKMLWNYSAPNNKQIGSDGKQSWIYDAADKQVLVSPAKPEGEAMSFLWGAGDIDKSFKAQQCKQDKSLLEATLYPIKPLSGVEKLRIRYDEQLGVITKIVIDDKLGNQNSIEFVDVKVNGSMNDKRFIMKVSKGTETVRY